MRREDLLLSRLDEIGASLARSNKARALIGLGSVGLEMDRLDRWSDLDFFAIVEDGYKQEFLDSLSWLSGIQPIAYSFRNTADGYKVLFEDGIFCELAVFEEAELHHIPFTPGRMIWKKEGVADSLRFPVSMQGRRELPSPEWSLGEALTNLYVGLSRDRRGEKLAALRLIQVHAVDRVLELAAGIEPEGASFRDPFALERRFEQRHPRTAQVFSAFMQGYERNAESARAILEFLRQNFEVNPALGRAIAELIER
jgi:hypothetical protein